MINNINDILGDDLVMITLEELKLKTISVKKAFEKIREIIKINLELFEVKKMFIIQY